VKCGGLFIPEHAENRRQSRRNAKQANLKSAQEGAQLVRQGTGERHIFAAARMGKLERCGVQVIALQDEVVDLFWRAVENIANNRMSDRGQVHADLVGTSGLDLEFEQGKFAVIGVQLTSNGVVGDSASATAAAGGHASAAEKVPADGRGDCAVLLL